MARYIDASKIKLTGLTFEDINNEVYFSLSDVRKAIEQTPAADVVEVVRCKDCAHYIEMKGFDYNGRKARSCVWHSALRGENDYCSDAIRTSKKGGEQE